MGWWTTSTETWAGTRQLDVAEIVASYLLSPSHSTQRRFVAVDWTKVQLGIMGPDVIETDQEGLRNDNDGEQAAHVLETKYNLTM